MDEQNYDIVQQETDVVKEDVPEEFTDEGNYENSR